MKRIILFKDKKNQRRSAEKISVDLREIKHKIKVSRR